MVASNKKNSNIVLAFLLPHRKERIYSAILKSTEDTNNTLLSRVIYPYRNIQGKQCLSIPELAVTICTDFSFTHNASIRLSEKFLIG